MKKSFFEEAFEGVGDEGRGSEEEGVMMLWAETKGRLGGGGEVVGGGGGIFACERTVWWDVAWEFGLGYGGGR